MSRVLNEPTAAALAYGYGKDKSEQIAVYDFGGGTFDITLLSLSKTAFRVRATAGDMFLGGDDLDGAIANVIAGALLKRHHYDARNHAHVFDQLRAAAEQIKIDLTTKDEVSVDLEEVLRVIGGKSIRFTFAMKRKELDPLIEPFVGRTLEVCERALARVQASPRDFHGVVLVGGSTRLPLVRQRVAESLGARLQKG